MLIALFVVLFVTICICALAEYLRNNIIYRLEKKARDSSLVKSYSSYNILS